MNEMGKMLQRKIQMEKALRENKREHVCVWEKQQNKGANWQRGQDEREPFAWGQVSSS